MLWLCVCARRVRGGVGGYQGGRPQLTKFLAKAERCCSCCLLPKLTGHASFKVALQAAEPSVFEGFGSVLRAESVFY